MFILFVRGGDGGGVHPLLSYSDVDSATQSASTKTIAGWKPDSPEFVNKLIAGKWVKVTNHNNVRRERDFFGTTEYRAQIG
jgi:hypothetical protein